MSVLSSVLETLPGSRLDLEAYDRAGHMSATVNATQLCACVEVYRRRLRAWDVGDWDVGGRKVVSLLFRPEEAIEFLVATLAAIAERWTVVPFYPNWNESTQKMYLETYNLRAMVVGDGFRKRAEAWTDQVDADGESERQADGSSVLDRVLHLSLTDVLAEAENIDEDTLMNAIPFCDFPADHACAWIFTSGTSGDLAKLTEITLENLDAAVENIRDIDFLYPGMTLHNPLSTSHIFAFSVILGLLAIKPRRIIFSDVQYLARLPQSRTGKVNALILVPIVLNRMRAGFYDKLVASLDPKTAPPQLRRLAKIPRPIRKQLKRLVQEAEEAVVDLERDGRIGLRRRGAILTARRLFGRLFRERLGSPEFVVVGGAKPNLQSMAFLEVMGVRCLQGWGMTETTGPLAVCSLGDRFRGAFGTCGPLFRNTNAYVEDGELVVEGPQVARGYHQPDGTFVSFNGRKSTGDYAEFDANGRLRVIGKASDRITTENGLNYNPIPIEERLQRLDLEREQRCEEIVIIGDGQPRLGAVFFLRENVQADTATTDYLAACLREFNVQQAIDERIGSWVVSEVSFKESGVLGPSGKLIRRVVEERFGEMFQRTAVGAR